MTSIDPASYVVSMPPGVMRLDALNIDADEVYAFDFDGVVSSSKEDDIYHLDTWPGEEDLLTSVAARLQIRCASMELKYRRHLLYQAAALRLGLEIEPGPAIGKIEKAAATSHVFVLTARTGWYAVERMRVFLEVRGVIPIDVFNIGRVKKDRQVDLLCREFRERTIYYVEDNPAHLAGVAALHHPNLELVLAERQVPRLADGELSEMVIDTLSEVLKIE